MRNEVITLITKSVEGTTVSEVEHEVFAEKRAISYKEFYAAQQVGIVPRHIFIVDMYDYEDATVDGQEPTELIYKDKHYVIKRPYERNDTIELTVEAAV